MCYVDETVFNLLHYQLLYVVLLLNHCLHSTVLQVVVEMEPITNSDGFTLPNLCQYSSITFPLFFIFSFSFSVSELAQWRRGAGGLDPESR